MSNKANTKAHAPIRLGERSLGGKWLEELDPRAKILCSLAFSLLIAVTWSLRAATAGLAFAFVLLLMARLPAVWVIRRTAAVNFFVIFLWVFLPIQVAWSADGGSLTFGFAKPGLELALLITVKVNAAFGILLALLGSSRVNDLLHALSHLRAPAKLVTLFFLFHRYLFVIYHEYRRMVRAMKARSFKPGTNTHTYRSYANLFSSLLVRSYDRSERVYHAMLCRGFNGTLWLGNHFSWNKGDTRFCTAFSACLCLIAFLELELI